MNNLNQFKGMNPYEINLLSKRIHELLRDHSQFIDRVTSLSEFCSKYDFLIEFLNENQIISQILDIDKRIFSDLIKSEKISFLIKENLDQTCELSFIRMKRLEKLYEILSQSKNLFEEKIHLERNFEKS